MSIQAKDLIAKVRELATKYPDAVYDQGGIYRYTSGKAGGGVGCIIGQALVAVDPTIHEKLCEIDKNGAATVTTLSLIINITGSEREIVWLADVQNKQDRRKSWKDAINYADANSDDELIQC